MTRLKVSFYTQGCRLNQAETATIERQFVGAGYDIVAFKTPSDIVVVNTCTVTENGDADTRRLVKRVSREQPEAKIALIGCQAQVLKEALLALPNVAWVVGNDQKMDLVRVIESPDLESTVIAPKIPRESFSEPLTHGDPYHTRANLKIQDGCDFYCAFCVIPFARGPARSRVFDNVMMEANSLVAAGHQEIVLTGINLGTYQDQDKTIVDVINGLCLLPDLKRIRISSIEPTTIPDDVICAMVSSKKLCRYLHIPLQSGSDSVLKGMNRHYTLSEFDAFVRDVRDRIPDACIGTDVIVGFPGESDDDFEDTYAYLLDAPIDYFHVFSYSERKFARSKKYEGQVSPEAIKQRSARLRELSMRKRRVFVEQFLGTHQDVLFETNKAGEWIGMTDHFIRVKVLFDGNLKNQFCKVKFDRILQDGCVQAVVTF